MTRHRRGAGRLQVITAAGAVLAVTAALAILAGCPDAGLLDPDRENANLSALTVSEGTLWPDFDPETTEYEVSLDSGVASVVVTGTPAAASAEVSENSGASQALESGANPITITVTAGDATTTKEYVVTVNRGAVGALDSSFDPGDGANGPVYAIAVQGDGKIVIGGSFTTVDGATRDSVARLNPDGSLDASFAPPNIWADLDVRIQALAVEPAGKVVIGGYFQTVGGQSRLNIARLNVDGSLDTSFDPENGANGSVLALALQSDGKIVIGGEFTYVDTTARNRIARLNADGSLDSAFDPGSGPGSSVNAIAVQSDGRIVIGGYFRSVSGMTHTYVARLEANGNLDSGFSTPYFEIGADAGYANAVSLQEDGRVVIGGAEFRVPDVYYGCIARLGTNGSLDTTLEYVSWSGVHHVEINGLRVQTDGRIVVGGRFTEVDGWLRANIARVDADGSLDTGFDPGAGANNPVRALVVQGDGKILIGGDFTAVGAQPRNRIARLK